MIEMGQTQPAAVEEVEVEARKMALKMDQKVSHMQQEQQQEEQAEQKRIRAQKY